MNDHKDNSLDKKSMAEAYKKNIRDILALTPTQEGMLFHYLKEPGSNVYFEQLSLDIRGKIQIRLFEKAWNVVIQTNEMLRTVFRWEGIERPLQIILKQYKLQPNYYDFTGKTPNEKKTCLEELKTKDRNTPFDLQEVPFGVTLCKIAEEKYCMMIRSHHILYDGWSQGILLKEFFNAYRDFLHSKEPEKPVKTTFKKFVRYLQNRDIHQQEKYWKNYLSGFDTQTHLSIKKRGEPADTKNFKISFTKDKKMALERFVKKYKITLASLLYGAWGILLQKYNNTDDVVFGVTMSGRSAKIEGIEKMVGLFINTLPLRVRSNPGEKAADLLYRIDRAVRQMEENETASLADIKAFSQLSTHEELFDSIVVIENYPLDRRFMQEKGILSVDSYTMTEKTHYDLTVGITVSEEIDISFLYNEGVFDNRDIKNMSRHLRGIIRDILTDGITVPDMEMITREEKNKILYDFNNTETHYPEMKTIHQLFEQQAARTPDAAAVNGSYRTYMTYNELNRKSNQLAWVLREKGVEPETIVGIMVEPSLAMAIGVLGILKAGGAYLPMDVQYPEERINYMLKDSGTAFLVHDGSREIVGHVSNIIDMNDPLIHREDRRNTDSPVTAAHAAYIIYTSGTTGRPKGVLNQHRGAVNTLLCRKEEYKMNPENSSLQLFSYTFDGFITSFFTPLISGARVILPGKGGQKDISQIKEAIVTGNVTHFISVPALFQALIDTLSRDEAARLKVVTLAGDTLLPRLLEDTRAKGENIEIAHEYGVTEAAVMSTICRHQQKKKKITIGKPAWNTNIYIMDKHMRLLPEGITGELCISGKGVARGYLNRPELTAERFTGFNRSYGSYRTYKSYRSYRTGDLGKWLPDGNIQFLGRVDHQVKIRGFRIELGEIENRLCNHTGVKEAVVLTREKGAGEKYLCAYIAAGSREHGAWSARELREYLSQTLPGYMIPSHFVAVEKIPLTATGKIDRKALPEPEVKQGDTYTAPGDLMERKLVQMWSEVLEVEPANIGIDDDFFSLGGHSLKATRLISKIHKEMNVKVPLDTLFETPTIRALAGYVKEAKQERYVSIPKAEKREYYPLSAAQKRLYITQHMKLEGLAYNVQNAVRLEGALSRQMVEEAFRKLIERHESFRTAFEMIDNEPVQRIHENVAFKIEYYSMEHGARSMEGLGIEQVTADFIKPFDLSLPPLLRVGLIKTGEENHLLMTDIHHIITDGVSISLLVKEFSAFYRGEWLPPLHIRYKDFSLWQQETCRNPEGKEILNRQEAYWLKQFEGEVPVLDLPFDYDRPAIQQFDGAVVPFHPDREKTALVKKIALEEGVTLFILLLAVFNIVLARICDQEDIVVGTPAAGRPHADLQPVIGLFVNMLVLRNRPDSKKYFRDFLKQVKEKTLEAFQNQDYPYEALVDKLSARRDAGRNALFDVVLVWEEEPDMELDDMTPAQTGTAGLKLTPYELERTNAPFDLVLTGSESGENMHFSIIYKTSLFKRKTIESMIGHFNEVLGEIITNPNNKLEDVVVSHDLIAAKSRALMEDQGDFGFGK